MGHPPIEDISGINIVQTSWHTINRAERASNTFIRQNPSPHTTTMVNVLLWEEGGAGGQGWVPGGAAEVEGQVQGLGVVLLQLQAVHEVQGIAGAAGLQLQCPPTHNAKCRCGCITRIVRQQRVAVTCSQLWARHTYPMHSFTDLDDAEYSRLSLFRKGCSGHTAAHIEVRGYTHTPDTAREQRPSA